LQFRQAQVEGDVDVLTVSQTPNTTSVTASFPNPCDNTGFISPVWEVTGLPTRGGDPAAADTSVRDRANGYGVRCAWDPQGVSACEVVAANGDVAATVTKLLDHGFWVEAVGDDVKNIATYNFVEEWLCANVAGSYP
jgi:hypothetical protein